MQGPNKSWFNFCTNCQVRSRMNLKITKQRDAMGGGKGFGSYKELENKATDPQVKLG